MEIESSEEEIEIIAIADEILAKHPSKRTLINSLHTLIVQFEAHLDTIIKRYKIMSITLLAAIGAAIGFSFSGEIQDVKINKLIMASVISIFGIIGLTAIWQLDIQVFHKFWGSFFIEEVKMEEKHSFLVDVGDIAVSLDNIRARIVGDGNWYIFLTIIFAILGATTLSFITTVFFIKILIFLASGLITYSIVFYMNKSSKKLLKVIEQMLAKEISDSKNQN